MSQVNSLLNRAGAAKPAMPPAAQKETADWPRFAVRQSRSELLGIVEFQVGQIDAFAIVELVRLGDGLPVAGGQIEFPVAGVLDLALALNAHGAVGQGVK